MDDDASGLSLRMEAVALSFRPLRVIVGLDYKAADAWFIEFRAAASQCMVRVDQPRARGRGAFSHAVSAHFSGGRGCFWGRGLAKHDCRADRTRLSRCGRVGQRVGCFSWSRSSCLCHSTLYRSCGAVIMSIHLDEAPRTRTPSMCRMAATLGRDSCSHSHHFSTMCRLCRMGRW